MYISTHQALLDFCQRACEFDAIAVDTEFLRERTFHPRLCLVQIATPAESVAVDPLVIDDLSPLAELMADESVTKVFHACSQDMEVMLHTVGVLPRPIWASASRFPTARSCRRFVASHCPRPSR